MSSSHPPSPSASPPGFVLQVRGHHAVLRLCRPVARNALNLATIEGMTAAVTGLPTAVRVLRLEGEGKSFCAGACLKWMQAAQYLDAAANRADAAKLADLFEALRTCPQAVLAVVHGPVRGGGCGLVAAADLAVCDEGASFCFSEVRLGLLPAVIAPAVVAKVGAAVARALFLTAEVFSPAQALAYGLVHAVVPAQALAAQAEATAEALAAAGPAARVATKALLRKLAELPPGGHRRLAADALAELRAGPEAQAGLAAFFARRPPPWVEATP